MTFVIIRVLDGSDSQHWQSRWEEFLPSIRIQPTSWTSPDLTDWSAAITHAVAQCQDDIIFIAHSLGCHALAHWLTTATYLSNTRALPPVPGHGGGL